MSKAFQVVSFNSEYIPLESFSLELDNRGFRYGDGLFETMHANAGKVQFLADHFIRLTKGANTLSLDLPDYLTETFIESHIDGLLHRCRLYQGAKVKLTLVRKTGGLYIPQTNEADVLIEASFLSKGPYELNKSGLVLGVNSTHKKPVSPLSDFKSLNAATYIMAGIFAKNNGFDDVVILNENGFLTEATSSNLFLVYNDRLITPHTDTGCVIGIMRQQIISIAEKLGVEVIYKKELKPEHLLEASEIFLTNAISGIRWVVAYENKRFVKRMSRQLLQELNQFI